MKIKRDLKYWQVYLTLAVAGLGIAALVVNSWLHWMAAAAFIFAIIICAMMYYYYDWILHFGSPKPSFLAYLKAGYFDNHYYD